TKVWQNPRLLTSAQTAFPNGQTSKTTYFYDSKEMQTEQDDYDFGLGFLRATVTSYATTSGMPAAHVIDKPATVTVYADAGKTVKAAETDFTYDIPIGSATSGIVHHGTGCNCGNVTKISRWVNSTGATVNTTFTNDDTGQRLSMTDPRGNITNYSYADS